MPCWKTALRFMREGKAEILKKHGVFKKFLVSYLVILIIPLCLGSFAYGQAVSIIKKDSVDARMFMLRRIQNTMDQFGQNLEETAVNLALDSQTVSIASYAEPEAGSPDYYWFYKYLNSLRTVQLNQGGLRSNFYLFCNKSQAVFTNSQVSFGFEDFYNGGLSFDHVGFDKWQSDYLKTRRKDFSPAASVYINGGKKSVIPYVVSVPLNATSTGPVCTIMYLINNEDITNLLHSVSMTKNGWTCILDQNGRSLSSYKSGMDLSKYISIPKSFTNSSGYFIKHTQLGNVLCVYTKSKTNHWTYITASPISDVMGQVYVLKQTTVYIALIALILGLFISICMAYRNVKPFQEAVQTLKGFWLGRENNTLRPGNDLSESEYLKVGISSLISDSMDIQDILKNQNKVLRNMFWERLFAGEFTESKKMKALMEHINLDFGGRNFIVVLIRINRQDDLISPSILDELDLLRSSIENTLKTQIHEKFHLHLLNENEAVLLLSFEENADDQLKQRIENAIGIIGGEMLQYFHMQPVFGVGNCYDSLMNVFLSLNEARQALNATDNLKGNSVNVFWYNQIDKDNIICFYPSEIEEKIINCVKVGRKKQIHKMLDLVYQQNFQAKQLSYMMQKLLFSDMAATLVKAVSITNMDLEIVNDLTLLKKCTPEQFFDSINEKYTVLCDKMSSAKKELNSKLKEDILEYVNQDIMNSELCVDEVASHFNLSESYFSQLFKEYTGTTCTVYIESRRIDFACRLIKDRSLSIDSIARKCGYNSTHSFRRVFKKVMGVLPSDYRK